MQLHDNVTGSPFRRDVFVAHAEGVRDSSARFFFFFFVLSARERGFGFQKGEALKFQLLAGRSSRSSTVRRSLNIGLNVACLLSHLSFFSDLTLRFLLDQHLSYVPSKFSSVDG